MLRDLLHIRLVKAELASQNLFLVGDRNREINQALLLSALDSLPRFTENPEIGWADLIGVSERFDQRSEEWSAPYLQPSEQAVLHRIIRGRLHQAGEERRIAFWKEDLRHFLIRRHSASLAPVLEEILEAYLLRVPHPFQDLDNEALSEVVGPVQAREGEGSAAVLRDSLLQFMASVGLPGEGVPPSTTPLSREGFSQSVFATYLKRFREIHSFRGQGALTLDENLLDRVLNDRLAEPPFESLPRPRSQTKWES
jgi:hypothetical protein